MNTSPNERSRSDEGGRQYVYAGESDTSRQQFGAGDTDGVTGAVPVRVGSKQPTVTITVPDVKGEELEPSDAGRVLAAIPAYNAADTIGGVVTEAMRFADQVLVVDDGSSDATAIRADEAGAIVVSHERNRGYGGALETIFLEGRELGADHLVTLDADGQHDASDIVKLVEAQRSSGAGVVIGSRYTADSNTRIPLVRSIGLGVVNLLTNATMGRFRPQTWVRDTQSGLRSYTRDVVESLATSAELGSGMEASTNIMFHAHRVGFEFEEVGATISYDVENANSQGALSHGLALVWNIFRHA